MKSILTFLFVLFLLVNCFSQTVENVKAEQDGEKINIFYDIINYKDGQTFKMSLSGLINDKRILLKSVLGDVGENIKGGKNKKIIWDVLKDVDELKSSEFYIKIEDIKDSENKTTENSKSSIINKKRSWLIASSFGISSIFGIIVGKIGNNANWGYYGSIRGSRNLLYNNQSSILSFMFITSRRFYKRLHLYSSGGFSYIQMIDPEHYSYNGKFTPTTIFFDGLAPYLDLGFIFNLKRINFNSGYKVSLGYYDYPNITLGIGLTIQ